MGWTRRELLGVRAVIAILVPVAGPALGVAGVTDLLTKSIGTANAHNVIHATVTALKELQSPEMVARMRGKSVEELGLNL